MSSSKLLILSRIVFYSALCLGCVMAFAPGGDVLHSHVNDKLLHACGLFLMAFLAHAAHPQARAYLPFIGLVLFGLGIELVQALLPYRSFSIMDWFADALGVAAYHLLFRSHLESFFASYRYGPG